MTEFIIFQGRGTRSGYSRKQKLEIAFTLGYEFINSYVRQKIQIIFLRLMPYQNKEIYKSSFCKRNLIK